MINENLSVNILVFSSHPIKFPVSRYPNLSNEKQKKDLKQRIFLRTSETSPRMATGKTIPSGFCSDGLGDEELQDERMILPKTTNKTMEAIFNRKSPRMLFVLGYSD